MGHCLIRDNVSVAMCTDITSTSWIRSYCQMNYKKNLEFRYLRFGDSRQIKHNSCIKELIVKQE